MKFSLVVLAAAASTTAFHFSKVFGGIRSLLRNDNTCDIANMGRKCSGPSCPPCWIKNGGKYDCYDKVRGQCPWQGMIDKSAKSKYPAPTCFYGNQQGRVCDTNRTRCPPCWIKSGGNWGCFDKVNQRCPWGGMTEIN